MFGVSISILSFSLGDSDHSGSPCRSLNVDMEWLYGASESSNMEVDIGYLPQVCSRSQQHLTGIYTV